MPSQVSPGGLSAFLSTHGAQALADQGLKDDPALVRFFRETAPSEAVSPSSPELQDWLSALLDAVSIVSEQLYEHHRALIDLFRGAFFAAARQGLPASPFWDGLRVRGVEMGFLPEDRFGVSLPCPHPGCPEIYAALKEVKCG